MPVSDTDVTNLIDETNIIKVIDNAAPDGSGYRVFGVALDPESSADLDSLMAPFVSDGNYEVQGPVQDAQYGGIYFLKCPTPRCPVLDGAAEDVRDPFGGG
ncbi:MAG TPA: hypothetical protein VKM93_13215 [Terriglobia bacterium]|nr:hypothetical protein [Terriglobia bacterium]